MDYRKLSYVTIMTHVLSLLASIWTLAAPSSTSQGLSYLVKFGYLKSQNPMTGALRSEDSFVSAIKRFQRMAGIPETGKVDNATRTMMDMPRCGNKDDVDLGGDAKRRRKRYALQGSKWAKKDLTFKISQYPRDISRERVEKEVHKALRVWGDVTPINFILRPYDDRVDINIRFARRNHGDGNPFDGRGRTLAHAFFPQYGGDAHFDADELWTIGLTTGVNMFQVAAHEFGHSLGLSHSDVGSALMAPFYRGYQRHFSLDRDDVKAIQELYGTPPRHKNRQRGRGRDFETRTTTPKPQRRPPSTRGPVMSVPKICTDSHVDAVTMTSDGYTYIFKGKKYYRLNNYGIAQGYPRDIKEDWKGLTGPIDSALHWDNGYTYIFKGEYYWKFYNFNLIYVRHIDQGFKGIPTGVDAAFVWGGNGKTYFVKGEQYWRYTVNQVDPGYPKPMTIWTGLPSRINAALKWKNGRTYFFSNDLYYRYNDVDFDIDPSYPRTTSNWWLGCPDREQINQIHNRRSGSLHDQPSALAPHVSASPDKDVLAPSNPAESDADAGPMDELLTEGEIDAEEFLQIDTQGNSMTLYTDKGDPNEAGTILLSHVHFYQLAILSIGLSFGVMQFLLNDNLMML